MCLTKTRMEEIEKQKENRGVGPQKHRREFEKKDCLVIANASKRSRNRGNIKMSTSLGNTEVFDKFMKKVFLMKW